MLKAKDFSIPKSIKILSNEKKFKDQIDNNCVDLINRGILSGPLPSYDTIFKVNNQSTEAIIPMIIVKRSGLNLISAIYGNVSK